ncbi:acetyltransferase [Coniochaeta sp. PMI_546]|nr:acetyltransferase [Coniochaeta sp. PMI_546]
MAASTHVFSSAEHAQLVPYLAALHASCITHDRMIGTFLPPLHHEKLLSWWKERIAEVNAGTRVIVVLLTESQPGARAKGTDLMGVAMLSMPESETGPFRGYVEKVLVSNKYRGHGGARALLNTIEAEALKQGRTLLTLDVESETAAEGAFKKLGYVEVGKIPKYSLNPAGQVRPQTFFYKDLTT